MFVSVHLVTESTDHYNYLIEYNDPNEVIEVLKELGTELGCVSDYWITCQAENEADEDYIAEHLSIAIRDQGHANHEAYLKYGTYGD
ncbi:putative Seg-like homing endonuclease [Acinetobacter phage vB_AbaM_Apostate]|uniref:Putative Seg-like homing endonuclease n=1 Tax=Acinetobacter phage vB_AbaM_Apostate TaxID=2686308 RepID=A0A6B9JBJ0_9CAUD|nr:putative Seg-like homing endonuclease [Acinetobacter phage vB_AbaM_Apostate]QGZ15726.1 putative Seg-like homing endonuclease [Acinetobacter phage vB_AbaM_Apostate]